MAILVEFERGETVELNAEKLEDTVVINFPIRDMVLDKETHDAYRYRLVIVRQDNQSIDEEWKNGSGTKLFVVDLS